MKSSTAMRGVTIVVAILALYLSAASHVSSSELYRQPNVPTIPGVALGWIDPDTTCGIENRKRNLCTVPIAAGSQTGPQKRLISFGSDDPQRSFQLAQTTGPLSSSRNWSGGNPHQSAQSTKRERELATVAAANAKDILAISLPFSRKQSNDALFDGFGPLAFGTIGLILATIAFREHTKARQRAKHARSEKAIYDAIAELAEEERNFQKGIGMILRRVEHLYQLYTSSIVLLQPATLEVQFVYTSVPQARLPNEQIDAAISAICNHSDSMSDMTLWRYPNQPQLSKTTRRTAAKKMRPSSVTTVVWLGNRLSAAFIAQCLPEQQARPKDAQELQRITRLLAIAIEGHSHAAANTKTSGIFADPAADNREGLASSIAHEFNNLLMLMMGYAEMAASTLQPGSLPRAHIGNIQSAGERAKRVIEQILTFSRRQQSESDTFDVSAAITEILPDLKMYISPSIDFCASLSDSPICVRGSATALQQAVINLCKNAGEAIADYGAVTVRVEVVRQVAPRVLTHGQLACRSYVCVSVKDTGGGMPADSLQRIFDPFFTTRATEGGTGLGLSMVLQTVKHLNGSLDVHSTPGSGSRFDLFFPYDDEVNVPMPNRTMIATG